MNYHRIKFDSILRKSENYGQKSFIRLVPGDEGSALVPLLGGLPDAGLLHPVDKLLVDVEVAS